MGDRVILHSDINCCYASIEHLHHPELAGKPLAVGGDLEARNGIVLTADYEAKKYGVKTGMALWQAKQACLDITFVSPRMDLYLRFSRMAHEIYAEYTDRQELYGIDECWLDVTESSSLKGDGLLIAEEISKRMKSELGITVSIGVSFNKIFAKMGSDYKKPNATTVISKSNFKELLWPMAVSEMFFVGRSTATKLSSLGIHTIGDLAHADQLLLSRTFGVHGVNIYKYANGLDDDPVRAYDNREDIKSVGHGMTFRRNLRGADDIGIALTELTDKVSTRLRRHDKWARGVKIEITTPEFKRFSRQKRLPSPINSPAAFRNAAVELISELNFTNKPIRLLTVTAIDLTDSPDDGQLTIFTMGATTDEKQRSEKDENIAKAMDEIRNKFGKSSIKFAHVIGNDIGIDED